MQILTTWPWTWTFPSWVLWLYYDSSDWKNKLPQIYYWTLKNKHLQGKIIFLYTFARNHSFVKSHHELSRRWWILDWWFPQLTVPLAYYYIYTVHFCRWFIFFYVIFFFFLNLSDMIYYINLLKKSDVFRNSLFIYLCACFFKYRFRQESSIIYIHYILICIHIAYIHNPLHGSVIMPVSWSCTHLLEFMSFLSYQFVNSY